MLVRNNSVEASESPFPSEREQRKRFVIVGTGARVTMFLDPVVGRFRESAQIVGLCDTSPTRMRFHLERIAREYGAPACPTAGPDEFEALIARQRPDAVIVCTPDALHHEYIIRALEAGVDAISEKPLTTDAPKCRAIFDAIARTGRRVRTTFNARWIPGPTAVRELVASGAVGAVRHVQFDYMLNTSHGADYFRRWHSEKALSGGLLVHKATHHFDLINWWTNAIPARAFAFGGLGYYGEANALGRGEAERTGYARYTGNAAAAAHDPYHFDLAASDRNRALYLDAEAEGGYLRDRNVFRSGIDIEDLMSVLIRYRNGVVASYTLNAFAPEEGCRVAITGDAGRLEYCERKAIHRLDAAGCPILDRGQAGCELRVISLLGRGGWREIPVPEREGSHGGGDALIQEQMFAADPPPETLGRNAGHEQGAASLLIGAAANESLATGRAVGLDDLLPLNPMAQHFSDLL